MVEKSKTGTKAKTRTRTKTKNIQNGKTKVRGDRTNNKVSKKALEAYRKSLLARREQLLGDVNQMVDEALGKTRLVSNGDVSTIPTHMADVATDAYEQEFTLELMANERQELKQIDHALDRITRGEFGVCEKCGGRILQARLRALPQARQCIGCKRQTEQGKG